MSETKFTPGGIGFGMPVRISKFLPEDCIYVASEGTLKKALLTFNTVADQELEIARLRSHVSRLEESLRVALEARAETVEVLRDCEWEGENMGRACCPECGGLIPYEPPHKHHFVLKDDRFGHSDDCRLARAIGGTK